MWSRELPSEPSSVRVYRDALGHWHASFVVEMQAEPYPQTGNVIGIDWGVKEIATTTDGAYDLAHPQFGRKAAADLARTQRKMARRKPGKGQQASAGAKTRLLLSERTFTCGACGAVLPRDTNSAAVMLVRAGLNPAGADRVRRAAAQLRHAP